MRFLGCFTTLLLQSIVRPAPTGTNTLYETSFLLVRNVPVLAYPVDRSSRGTALPDSAALLKSSNPTKTTRCPSRPEPIE